MSTLSPVGELLTRATDRSAKKVSSGDTQQAECGCRVSVQWFTQFSTSNKIEQCVDHAPNRGRQK